MSGHRLAPLLAPRSVALVGASAQVGSFGSKALRELVRGGFSGAIHPINPRYRDIDGLRCAPSLAALGEPVDLALLLLGADRLEQALADTIASGARAALIYDAAWSPPAEPSLVERLGAMADAAGLLVCGGNSSGFVNLVDGVRAFPWPPAHDLARGNVAFISHSGSTFGGLLRNERRLDFNLAVSAGQELTVTTGDYLDFVLDLEGTAAVGLFLETVRAPERFRRALDKAQARGVPVVALKVARSQFAAELALSHSGALAGNDAAYGALFRHHGVIQVDDIDELTATLQLFSQRRRVGRGGLAAIGDSGGERELLVDLAETTGVPFCRPQGNTVERLKQHLHPSLRPVNPLDAYGVADDYLEVFEASLDALLADDGTALGLIVSNVLSGFELSEGYLRICERMLRRTGKPLAVATLYAGTEHGDYALRMKQIGVPVIYGLRPALQAVRNLMRHRDAVPAAAPDASLLPPASLVASWRDRLRGRAPLDEAESLALLADFGIPVQPSRVVASAAELIDAIRSIGYPVALKTAMPGIHHKSDVNGVVLGLTSEAELAAAYADLAHRLGPRAMVAPMAPPGVEIALGMTTDPQFGPVVMVGAGGSLIEVFRDVRHALPPFDVATARELIDGLAASRLLRGMRDRPAADLEALAVTLARFSALASALRDVVAEIDLNPFIVHAIGGVAVDALVVPQRAEWSRAV